MNKATKDFDTFLNEGFSAKGEYKSEQAATPSESNCRYCFAKDDEVVCPVSWYVQKLKKKKQSKVLVEKAAE
jgi:hypothetical protein